MKLERKLTIFSKVCLFNQKLFSIFITWKIIGTCYHWDCRKELFYFLRNHLKLRHLSWNFLIDNRLPSSGTWCLSPSLSNVQLLFPTYKTTCEISFNFMLSILLQSHSSNILTDDNIKNRIWECHLEKNKSEFLWWMTLWCTVYTHPFADTGIS